MAVAGCRWKPCTDADHVRRSRRTPARRTRNSLAVRLRRLEAGAHWQRCIKPISARCLWRGAGGDVAGGSPGNQIGRTGLGPDGSADEIPGINWQKPDEGIWEVRGGRKHFTHSKVMAWLAFDRAVKLVEDC